MMCRFLTSVALTGALAITQQALSPPSTDFHSAYAQTPDDLSFLFYNQRLSLPQRTAQTLKDGPAIHPQDHRQLSECTYIDVGHALPDTEHVWRSETQIDKRLIKMDKSAGTGAFRLVSPITPDQDSL